MKDAESRNARVEVILADLLARAASSPPALTDATEPDLTRVVSSHSKGLREILLVAIVGRLLDVSYQPATSFYDINPRPLYEGPIRRLLDQYRIPRGKSGPLNVAKAADEINEQWATRRSDKTAAHHVVQLMRRIGSMSPGELESLGVTLCQRLLAVASRVAALNIEIQPAADPTFLHDVCKQLIEDAPDAGNTPQKIVGLLLETYHTTMQTGIAVTGLEDKASTTSTTGKKLGDITEEKPEGSPTIVYEVTVKKFDEQRVIESYEAVRQFDQLNSTSTTEVLVVCRPVDAHPGAVTVAKSSIYLGKLEYLDIIYHFVEIYEWIMAQLLKMTPEARLAFHSRLHLYVQDTNTSEPVKERWRVLHHEGDDQQ